MDLARSATNRKKVLGFRAAALRAERRVIELANLAGRVAASNARRAPPNGRNDVYLDMQIDLARSAANGKKVAGFRTPSGRNSE